MLAKKRVRDFLGRKDLLHEKTPVAAASRPIGTQLRDPEFATWLASWVQDVEFVTTFMVYSGPGNKYWKSSTDTVSSGSVPSG